MKRTNERPSGRPWALRLKPADRRALERVADARGVSAAELVRGLIRSRLIREVRREGR